MLHCLHGSQCSTVRLTPSQSATFWNSRGLCHGVGERSRPRPRLLLPRFVFPKRLRLRDRRSIRRAPELPFSVCPVQFLALQLCKQVNGKHAPKAAGCVGLDRARLVGGEAAQAWDAGGDHHGEVEREEERAAARLLPFALRRELRARPATRRDVRAAPLPKPPSPAGRACKQVQVVSGWPGI